MLNTQSIRCRCGKIVCQVFNMPELPRVEEASHPPRGPSTVILCRHCKRYVVLQVPSVTSIHYASDVDQLQAEPQFTTRS